MNVWVQRVRIDESGLLAEPHESLTANAEEEYNGMPTLTAFPSGKLLLAWARHHSNEYGQVTGQTSIVGNFLAEQCQTGPGILCIDSVAGDGAFRLAIDFSTTQGGGLSGRASAIPLAPLGVTRGGLFWFFGADNPEVLAKVLDGCAINGKHWFFSSAGTNVGYRLTLLDTRTGASKTYANRDLVEAVPIQDSSALPCPAPPN